jgi:aminomethyltransferase
VEALKKLTDIDLGSIKYYNFRRGKFAGCKNVIVSATGYTGSGGFLKFTLKTAISSKYGIKYSEAGEKFGIETGGPGRARYPAPRNGDTASTATISTTKPVRSEAASRLAIIPKLNEGADFPSKEKFVKQKADGVKRKLVAFTLDNERRVPRHDYHY